MRRARLPDTGLDARDEGVQKGQSRVTRLSSDIVTRCGTSERSLRSGAPFESESSHSLPIEERTVTCIVAQLRRISFLPECKK